MDYFEDEEEDEEDELAQEHQAQLEAHQHYLEQIRRYKVNESAVFTLHTIQTQRDKNQSIVQDALNFNTYLIKHIAKERKRQDKANEKHIQLMVRLLQLNVHKLSHYADRAWARRDIQPFEGSSYPHGTPRHGSTAAGGPGDAGVPSGLWTARVTGIIEQEYKK